jgi:hypothetical protein
MFEFVTQHKWEIAVVLAMALLAAACAVRYSVHPGALNKTDSAAYDALLVAESTIDQARLEYQAGQLTRRDALDALIASYNLAREAWLTYRGAIMTNVPQQVYSDRLSKNLEELTNAVRAINSKEAK